MSKSEYDTNWLKKKGFFKKGVPVKINKKQVVFDLKNKLAYVEVSDNEELEKLRKIIVRDRKVRYIWFYNPRNNSIKVHKKIGEVRWFHYNPNIAKSRTDYHKSKQDKLNKFSPNNINVLFDIKDIVNRFYNQLWEVRLEMAKSIGNQLKDDKNKLMVAQNFIDRLIFFYFLSQLGLIEIKSEGLDKPWILNRENTRKFFEWIINSVRDDYELQDFLNTLFFDVLGKGEYEVWNYSEAEIDGEKFSIIGPSLDGGLFREEIIEGKREREIKMRHIHDLIKVLNQYNWIIGEEVPGEEEVIGDLTPEVIGHIYEKFVVSLEQLEQIGFENIELDDINVTKQELRKGRKKIGAYYTPEEITNYISMNTIYPYITDRINQRFGTKYKNIWSELLDDSTWRVIPKERKEKIRQIKYLYFDVLRNLKILDNACGSGSFLLAATDVLSRLYGKCISLLEQYARDDEAVKLLLEDIDKAPNRDYYIARQIITNNLYGVDIMEGAVEIAKLRFWLYLISTLKKGKWNKIKIETLPNLDFNLMVGNSLIGFIDIEEFDLSPAAKTQMTLDVWVKVNKEEKTKMWLKRIGGLKEKYKKACTEEARKLRKKLENELNRAREILNKEYYKIMLSNGLDISWDDFKRLKPFHWGLEFYEVFELDKPKEERGFDIIIGNPPYIMEVRNNKELFRVYKSTLLGQRYYEPKMDIFYFFLEQGIDVLKSEGYLGYIVQEYWISREYAKKLRRKIFTETTPSILVFFREFNIFPDAPGQHNMILILKKESPSPKAKAKILILKPEALKVNNKVLIPISKEFFKTVICDVTSVYDHENDIVNIFGDIVTEIRRYMEDESFYLDKGEIQIGIDVHQPFLTSRHLSKVSDPEKYKVGEGIFVLSSEEFSSLSWNEHEKQLLKPFHFANELDKFSYSPTFHYYLIYTPKDVAKDMKIHPEKYPNIVAHLDRFQEIITSDNKPYGLHRARQPEWFEDPTKIMGVRKTKYPKFTVVPVPYYVDQAVVIIRLVKHKEYNPYYVCAVLNSKLSRWVLYNLKTQGDQLQIDKSVLLKFPIAKADKNQQIGIILLSEYLHFINVISNVKEEYKKQLQDYRKTFENLLDFIIYEIYFKEKFYRDGFYTKTEEHLLKLVSRYLKPINYDEWIKLYRKKQNVDALTPNEEKKT